MCRQTLQSNSCVTEQMFVTHLPVITVHQMLALVANMRCHIDRLVSKADNVRYTNAHTFCSLLALVANMRCHIDRLVSKADNVRYTNAHTFCWLHMHAVRLHKCRVYCITNQIF